MSIIVLWADGRVGSLVDDSGRFYKPLQDGARGDKETLFYDKIWSDTAVPPAVKAFFPHFYGTINIDAPDGSSINILQSPIFSSSNPNCFVWGFWISQAFIFSWVDLLQFGFLDSCIGLGHGMQ